MKKSITVLYAACVVCSSGAASLQEICFRQVLADPALKQRCSVETVGQLLQVVYSERIRQTRQHREKIRCCLAMKPHIFQIQQKYTLGTLKRMVSHKRCIKCRSFEAENVSMCDAAFGDDVDQLCAECMVGQLCKFCTDQITETCMEDEAYVSDLAELLALVYQEGDQLMIDCAHEQMVNAFESARAFPANYAAFLYGQGRVGFNFFVAHLESLSGGSRYLQQLVTQGDEPWAVEVNKRLVHKELKELRPRRMMNVVIADLAAQFEPAR